MNYYRITAYEQERNFSFIIDSNGKFDSLFDFSNYLVNKGFQVIKVSRNDNMLDVNIEPAKPNNECLILRASCKGKPEYITQNINGHNYNAVKVGDKIYIPNK